jgi:colanic acid/amylovoran biosynthesis glycosyltransferase
VSVGLQSKPAKPPYAFLASPQRVKANNALIQTVPELKIAYILNTYPQPSHSFIRREIQALEQAGLDITRLAMRPSEAALIDPQDISEASHTGYVLQHHLGLITALVGALLRGPIRWFRALSLALRIGGRSDTGRLRHLIYFAEACFVARHCRTLAVDHMHAHFGTNAAAVVMLANAVGGPSYSFTVHGPEEFDAPKALSLGQKLDRSAFAIAVSQFGRSQLCRWAALSTWPRLHVVHCGIDRALFACPAPMADRTDLRLVSIGRFAEQKGQLVLLQALAKLRQHRSDIHLTLVGDGEMRGVIEQMIEDLGLTDAVTLPGWQDEVGVRTELAAAHALVMPSFAEGLPVVIMEAMAAGRPVIATLIAGIPELVIEGKTGWLVPAGDVDALATAISELAQTTVDRLTEMGQAGHVRAFARHDVSGEAAKLADLFRAV